MMRATTAVAATVFNLGGGRRFLETPFPFVLVERHARYCNACVDGAPHRPRPITDQPMKREYLNRAGGVGAVIGCPS